MLACGMCKHRHKCSCICRNTHLTSWKYETKLPLDHNRETDLNTGAAWRKRKKQIFVQLLPLLLLYPLVSLLLYSVCSICIIQPNAYVTLKSNLRKEQPVGALHQKYPINKQSTSRTQQSSTQLMFFSVFCFLSLCQVFLSFLVLIIFPEYSWTTSAAVISKI